MATSKPFTLRPLERNPPPASLEGSFRVHLSGKDLKLAGLSNGDLVRLATDEKPKGFAIAWTTDQTNPGNKPIAKVTDFLKDEYALSLKEPVFIEKRSQAWKPVETIELGLVNSTQNRSEGYSCDEEFLHWTRNALAELEILRTGGTFQVQNKSPRLRHKNTKMHMFVADIKPAADVESAPFFDLLKSKVDILDLPVQQFKTPVDETLHIKSHGVGGLDDHFKSINQRLAMLKTVTSSTFDRHLFGPTSFLLHGAEGTGKSLILERLSECSWQQVFRIDPDWLSSNSKSPVKALSECIEKARSAQPSLILMDDLDKLLQKAEVLTGRLRSEIQKLQGTQVVVAAAARTIYDIDSSLRTAASFKIKLELFPPNVRQREDILRQILGSSRRIPDIKFAALAERSHGFVGRDIRELCDLARDHRVLQIYQSMQDDDEVPFSEMLEKADFATQEDFDAVIDQIQPTVLKDSILEVPKVRWSEIAGLDHVRATLEAITVRPFKYPDLDIKFGGPQSRKGVLLYGPPGCAKTLIAQAVATESNQNFLAVKGSELIKMYVGESERAIRDIFRRARAAKPCIIFFDEIDSIGKSREKTQDSGLNVVATLLNEMDGIEALKEVFIIGATNRPDILDSALIRTGRFDAHIHIGLPNEDARRQIFQIHTRKRPLARDVDLNVLASRTEGSSGADIQGLCAVAVEMATSDYIAGHERCPEQEPEVRMNHFERALDEHVPHTIQEEAARYESWRPGKSLSAE